jgi:hypothetical protein
MKTQIKAKNEEAALTSLDCTLGLGRGAAVRAMAADSFFI